MHLKAARDSKQLISKVFEWEDKWARMVAEHKNTLPAVCKMAAWVSGYRFAPIKEDDEYEISVMAVEPAQLT